MNLYDKRGIPIHVGDVLKLYHYRERLRREKRYMYKWVVRKESKHGREYFIVDHLEERIGETFNLLADDRISDTIEIVQGYAGVEPGQDYRSRPRMKGKP